MHSAPRQTPRKSVLLTLITTYGLKHNSHSDIIQNEVTLEDLFS